MHFISESGRVLELLWSGGTWHANDLIALTGGPLADFSSIAAYADPADYTRHVAYVGDDGCVHELWADASGCWSHSNIGADAGAGADASGSLLCAYVFPYDRTRHVMYVGSEGHVKELWQDWSGWHSNDLMISSGAPLADFAPLAGYATSDMQYVNFIQIDGLHVYELRWQSSLLPITDVAVIAVSSNE